MPQDIVNVNISLQTSGVSRAGFGTPIFIGSHRWFNERVKSYNSLAAAAGEIPTGSNEYKALQAFFANTPSPQTVKIGRREANITLDFAETPSNGDVFTLTVKDTDGDTVGVSYTAGALDDEEAVVDAIKAAIDADASVSAHVSTTKNGTGAATTLTLSPSTGTDTYSLSGLSSNLTYTFATTEVAGDVLTACETEDDDFYFVTAHDHTSAFVQAMSTAVQAREKLYFVALQDSNILSVLADPPTDLAGIIADSQPLRTVGLFHHQADTTYPECNYVGWGAPYTPGTITWHLKNIGVSVSSDPTTGKNLTSTQKDYVEARNFNYVASFGSSAVVRNGKVLSGNFIDEVRILDFLTARIKEAYQTVFKNTLKIPYTDNGINRMRSVLTSTLDRYVSSETTANILQEDNPYTTSFPRASEVSFADKQARTLTGSFTAYLAGAIHMVQINGVLTLEATG